MIEYNLVTSLGELKKFEGARSYSLKIENTAELGESCIFINDIEVIAKHSGNTSSKFYKEVSEMIKASKCPIIISSERVPVNLYKVLPSLHIMHVTTDKKEVDYILRYMGLVYTLEDSGIKKKLSEALSNSKSIEEIANTWKEKLKTINYYNEDKINYWIMQQNFNINKILQSIYNDLHDLVKPLDNAKVDFTELEEWLDYESVKDCGEVKVVDERSVKAIRQFLFDLSIKRAYLAEYPFIIELLEVRVKNKGNRQ